MRMVATWVQFACDWWVVAKQRIDLACLAASRMQSLHALAAIALQSRQYFAMTQGVYSKY